MRKEEFMKHTPFFRLFTLFTRYAAPVLALALALAGCGDPSEENDIPLPSLVNTIWAGETPRSGDWLTVAFQGSGKVVMSFVADNSTNQWTFTYDDAAKTGTISTGSGWSPAPDGFSVSRDAMILTIRNYGGHGGLPRMFRRVRAADAEPDPNLFPTGALPAGLVNTVWSGPTPANDGKGWLTVAFRSRRTENADNGEQSLAGTNVAVLSYTHDNTTAVWEYVYDDEARTGTAPTGGRKPDDSTASWNPGAYTISADGKTLTFTGFMGSPRSFPRRR
jgi:hypothetical protein